MAAGVVWLDDVGCDRLTPTAAQVACWNLWKIQTSQFISAMRHCSSVGIAKSSA